MTVETAMTQLEHATEQLADAVSTLRLTVCEDAPRRDRVLLVDELCDGVCEFVAANEAMLDALPDSSGDVGDDAPAVVAAVNARWLEAQRIYSERLVALEQIEALEALAERRRGAWGAWLGAAKRSLTDCGIPMRGVSEALYRAWSELVQRPQIRLGSATVDRLSVHGGDTDRLNSAAGATVRRLHPEKAR